jgi:hypothetical protein
MKVNTPSHLRKFASKMYDNVDKKTLQSTRPLEDIPLDMNISDWIYQLLFAGIGIYSPDNKKLNQQYNDTVLNLAANGQLAFLISDDSICYGANYPFSHVIIQDEVAEKHSINTIFQLAGRAGRVGTSWVAFIHIGDNTTQRIISYIRGEEGSGISEEAINLEKCFNDILYMEKEQNKQLQKKKAKPDDIIVVNYGNDNMEKVRQLIKMNELREKEKLKQYEKPEVKPRHKNTNGQIKPWHKNTTNSTQSTQSPQSTQSTQSTPGSYVPPHLRNKNNGSTYPNVRNNKHVDKDGWTRIGNGNGNKR